MRFDPKVRTFTYSSGRLASKTDARNQTLTYGYDLNKRMTSKYGATLYYDTNPFGTSENTWGQLAAVEYGGYRESYGYTRGGRMKWKRLTTGDGALLAASWQWDNEGRMARVTYPLNEAAYTYSYDTMGRLSGMVDYQTGQPVASGAQYNVAGQMTSLSYLGVSETRQYNTRLQLTRITASGYQLPAVDLEYRYSASSNDGRITQMKDWATGEEVNYTYDSLARLSAAWTTGPEWGQAYSFDGWGNLTGKSVTKGSAPTFSAAYDGATNRQVGVTHDANGNVYATGYTIYDAENRMTNYGGSPTRTYKYDASNRRVLVQEYSGPGDDLSAEEVTFYGPGGERLGVYRRSISHDPYEVGAFGGGQAQVWFGGKLIQAGGQKVVQDRLGSVAVEGSERVRFWPYGEERGTTAQKRQKWATYWRDDTGLDYAMARYQQNGRFRSPDPYIASGGAGVPQSWNRYAYVENDPVNFYDPRGQIAQKPHCDGYPNDPNCSPFPSVPANPNPAEPEPNRISVMIPEWASNS